MFLYFLIKRSYNLPIIILFILKLFSVNIMGQDFDVSPLVTIQGDNQNFDIASPLVDYSSLPQKSYICWLNQLDSLYTIHLKCIDPQDAQIYTVWSDDNQNANPQISYVNASDSIRIVWQSLINDHWGLYTRGFKDGKFGEVTLIGDTTANNMEPSLSDEGLAWIQDGKLLYRKISTDTNLTDSVMIVDSSNCSNPKIYRYESQFSGPMILYEKGGKGNEQIYIASYIGQIREQKPYWKLTQLSDSCQNINPSFATFNGITYQRKKDSIWVIVYSDIFESKLSETKNIFCNYEHPVSFNFPIPTGSTTGNLLGFFLAFDSDTLFNNKEIFINYFQPFSEYYTLINISNAAGNDIKPVIVYLNFTDSTKVAIVWEHIENNKTDIWWAVSTFHLLPMAINSTKSLKSNFVLYQNYPNPFNPSTVIKYQIPKDGYVSLKVYDLLGREVATLVNEYKRTGRYEITFNAGSLASGMYIYQLRVNNFVENKKLVLLK